MKNALATSLLIITGIFSPLLSQDTLLQNSSVEINQTNTTDTALKTTSLQVKPNSSTGNTSISEYKGSILSVNVFQITGNLKGRVVGLYQNSRKELSSLSHHITAVKENLSDNEYRERIISLLIILAVSIGVAFLCGILLWRIGVYFRSLSKNQTGHIRHLSGSVSTFLIRISLWASIAICGFCLQVIPWGLSASDFLMKISAAFAVYGITIALIQVFLSPGVPQFRILPWSDKTSTTFAGRVTSILRYSLFIYIACSFSQALGWTFISAAIFNFYMITLTFLLPRLVYTFRNSYSTSVVNFIRFHKLLPPKLCSTIELALTKLHLVLFLFMATISTACLFGKTELYSFLLNASVKTSVLVTVVTLSLFLWGYIYKKLSSSASSNYLGLHKERNRLILEKGGHSLILLSGSFAFLEIWGANILNLLKTDNPVLKTGTHITFIVVIGFVAIQVLNILINRFQKEAAARMLSSDKSNPLEVEKRVSTLEGIFRKIAFVTVMIIAAMMIIEELGYDIKAILTGLGVVGVAIGFGAQNLVRDVISGLFVIFENRIRVGDVAIINGTSGFVEQVNLRTSVLRSQDGTIHVFPNGAITSLSNMTHEYSYYVFNIGIAYNEDTDKVISVLKEVGAEIMENGLYRDAILEPLEVLGVDSFESSAVMIKARIKTLPIKQWGVGREMNRLIKKRFAEKGIEIPFPKTSIHFGKASKPLSVQLEGAPPVSKDEIRRMILETMSEQEKLT
ncbi:MAG: mechanosensitive ion channel [Fibrobacter sp.]|nr:mechanosensitive ion channel [Fibrobacter sp.]